MRVPPVLRAESNYVSFYRLVRPGEGVSCLLAAPIAVLKISIRGRGVEVRFVHHHVTIRVSIRVRIFLPGPDLTPANPSPEYWSPDQFANVCDVFFYYHFPSLVSLSHDVLMPVGISLARHYVDCSG